MEGFLVAVGAQKSEVHAMYEHVVCEDGTAHAPRAQVERECLTTTLE